MYMYLGYRKYWIFSRFSILFRKLPLKSFRSLMNVLSVCLSSSPALSTISLFFSALISKLLNSSLYLNKDLNRDLLTSLVFVMILSTVTIESPVFTLFYASKDQRCRLVGGYDRIAYVISSDLKFLGIVKCRCYLH